MSGLTRDDVVRMAREIFGQSAVLPVPELERFAAMAYAAGQAAEREEIAVWYAIDGWLLDESCVAEAIRARG